jgi:hypothetical protein
MLSTVTDPRDRRGVRHQLATVLTLAVAAVAAGARSVVAIARWAGDLPRAYWPRFACACMRVSSARDRSVSASVLRR